MNQGYTFVDRLDSLVAQNTESEFYAELLTHVTDRCHRLGFMNQEAIASSLERFWLPVALDLATASNNLTRTFVQGILGGQGTGKSTLCEILKEILSYLGFSTGNLSLDDLYLTYDERQALRQQDPRLIWRGPPLTHDVALGIKIIDQCLDEDYTAQISLPRFNKSLYKGEGDRTVPEIIDKPDILLFEGWFVGVQPIEETLFDHPPDPIVTEEDRNFAIENNQRLQAYVPLWSKLDSLIVLQPEDYRLSMEWRREAEHQMIAQGRDGMTDEEIERFVEYFWKALHPELFIEPLTGTAEVVVEINRDHTLGRINRPANSWSDF